MSRYLTPSVILEKGQESYFWVVLQAGIKVDGFCIINIITCIKEVVLGFGNFFVQNFEMIIIKSNHKLQLFQCHSLYLGNINNFPISSALNYVAVLYRKV